jgi:hypothetical protein
MSNQPSDTRTEDDELIEELVDVLEEIHDRYCRIGSRLNMEAVTVILQDNLMEFIVLLSAIHPHHREAFRRAIEYANAMPKLIGDHIADVKSHELPLLRLVGGTNTEGSPDGAA